jgi:vanillate monooxygenase
MFLYNAWYVAAWDHEVGRALLPRTLLSQNVVLFRTEDGAVAALEDRCCHRHAPLSVGKLVGSDVQCGYHGLLFDRTGRCVRVPSQSLVPPGAQVRSYPVVERHRWIWIWMGDAAAADAALIPDMHWHDDPAWRLAAGDRFHVKCHYQALIDIQLDQTHSKYVHPTSLANDGAITTPALVRREGGRIHGGRVMANSDPQPLMRRAADYRLPRADVWIKWTYTPPCAVTFDTGIAEPGTGALEGDRSRGITIFNSHGSTPETERTTHYFWSTARNYRLDDAAADEVMREIRDTFLEDVAMVEAQQRAIEAFPAAPAIDISADAPTIQARALVSRLIAAEQAL